MYYGEEIGMENNDPKRPEDVKDSMGKLGWPKEKGRDGERTPMQWNDSPNAGFSGVAPWLPVDERYPSYNVETEKQDAHSIFGHYHALLWGPRHTNQALLEGNYMALNEQDANVLSYTRSYKGQSVLVVLNMTGVPQKVKLNLAATGAKPKSAKTLLASFAASQKMELNEIAVEPFGAWVGEIE